jgi:hypothetical protein
MPLGGSRGTRNNWTHQGGTHQLLACADDFNIMGGNRDTIMKNTEASLDASKEVGLIVNPEET